MRAKPSTFVAGLLVAGITAVAPVQAQTIPVPGLSDQVEVFYDFGGVPHVYATNQADAAFMQGWIHAQDRFFQMDFTRRAASGTVAELVGQAGLANDIQIRTLGLRRAAWETYTQMDDDTRGLLQAYANGVNFWLQNNDLPPEYGGLELSGAEFWSPVDTIVIGKILAFQLSFDLDIDMTIALATYQAVGDIVGFDGTTLFFEDTHRTQPPDDRVTVPGFLGSIGGLGKADEELSASNKSTAHRLPDSTIEVLKAYRDSVKDNPLFRKALLPHERDVGSNLWAVAPQNSANGYAMFANDPHLALDLPAIWYEGHVNVSGDQPMNALGVQLAGVPGIVQGCTDQDTGDGTRGYCWGSTVNPMDVTDTFIDPILLNTFGLPTHTVHDGQPEPIMWIFQTYFMNNIGDGEMDNLERANIGYTNGGMTFVVPRRNNGPILDLDLEARTAITVQYTGWGATQEIRSFSEINRGSTLADFQEALTYFDVGAQNFGYADTDGNIAYFTSAEMPLREDLQTLMAPDGGIPPYIIRDGSGALMHEWMPLSNPQPNQAVPYEILPMDEMAFVINPDAGYIANANNDPVGTSLDNNPLNQVRPGGGLWYQNPGFASLRMGRIDRVLADKIAAGELITADDMKELQANNQLLDAELVMPFVLEAVDNALDPEAWPGLAQFFLDARVMEAVSRLAAWDFTTPTGLDVGYDPRDIPFVPSPPTDEEIASSVAATIFSTWRGQFVGNTIDATLEALSLGGVRPGSRLAYHAMIHHLRNFDTAQGVGASGIPFFNVAEAPTPADARDFIILFSLQQALDLLASDDFAAAFDNSTDQNDYRWGKLHRIEFEHPLGPPFNLPNGLYGLRPADPDLAGVGRSGGYEAVDASSHSARADGVNDFMFGAGPSRRFVGVMTPAGADPYQIIAGGQSGVLGSPAYASQLYQWLVNDYRQLVFDRASVEASSPVQLIFGPAGQ